LFVPAGLMMVVAELKMDRMRQAVVAYLREFGVDVSGAPKLHLKDYGRERSRSNTQ